MPHEIDDQSPEEETTPRKKPQLRTKKLVSRKKALPSEAEQRIDSGLASIYQNENGRMPDMKKIDIKKRHPVLGFIMVVLIIGSLMAFAAWIGFFVVPNSGRGQDNQVSLSIEGPDAVTLGATTTYKITYTNNQDTDITNATLDIWYPAGFIYNSSSVTLGNATHNEAAIGTIPANSEGTITITGVTYGAINQAGSLRLSLKYQPKNINSTLQKTADMVTTVTNSPFTVAIQAADKISPGSQTEFTFVVKNNTSAGFSELRLTPVLPANFAIASTTPALSDGKQWIIKNTASSTLTNASPRTFVIRGTLNDEEGGTFPIRANLSIVTPGTGELYKIVDSGVESTIVKTGTLVSVAINGKLDNQSVTPGNTLNFTVRIKNTSTSDIKDVSALLAIDGPSYKNQSILKWSAITDKYDGDIKGEQISEALRHGQISWTKKKIPELATLKAGQELNIDIQLPLKTNDDIDLKNFTESKITSLATVLYTDVSGAQKTASASPINVTINSDLSFEARDTSTTQGGQEEHAINWIINNTVHPLKNIVLSATVFGSVGAISTSTVPAGTATFDTTTKKLTWTIPEMPESVDVLAWPFTVTLGSKNPTQNTLISKVTITAEDTVTGETLQLTGNEIPLKAQ